MKKDNRVSLRNKFVDFLNNKEMLGCRVYSGVAPHSKYKVKSKEKFFWRFVMGTAKDGRTILIYPLINRSEQMPVSVFTYMAETEDLGAIVGTARNIGDCFLIVVDNPIEYKRTKQTRKHRYFLARQMRKENGSAKESSSEAESAS